MKILKPTGTYLKKSSEQRLILLAVVLVIGLPTTLFLYLIGSLLAWLSLLLVFIFGASLLSGSLKYHQGSVGEEYVTNALSSLSDEYLLINDVLLNDGYGNIDHVVLGSNGIFVIETKNYTGTVVCSGDVWEKQYGWDYRFRSFSFGSPSKQAKRNAMRIKNLLNSSNIPSAKGIWIDGVVVFVNQHIDLRLRNPTVPVLKMNELCDYIKNKTSRQRFSSKELELMSEVILKAHQSRVQ